MGGNIPNYIHTLYTDLLKFNKSVDELSCGIFPDGRQYHINSKIQVDGWVLQEKFAEAVSIQDFLYLMSYGVNYYER